MLAAEKSSQSWPTSTEKCQDDNRASVDSSETDESDNHEYYSGDIDSAGKQMMSFLHSSIQMRKMPIRGQMPHAQDEP